MSNLPVPTQRTWSVNDVVTAAMMNSNVRDAVNFLANPPLFVGYSAASASYANNTWQGMLIDTNTVDTYGGHSTTVNTSRYTGQVAGWYDLTVRSTWASNATGVRGVALSVVNSATVDSSAAVQTVATSGGVVLIQASARRYLNAGDYITFLAFQNSGGTLASLAGDNAAEVEWVHA